MAVDNEVVETPEAESASAPPEETPAEETPAAEEDSVTPTEEEAGNEEATDDESTPSEEADSVTAPAEDGEDSADDEADAGEGDEGDPSTEPLTEYGDFELPEGYEMNSVALEQLSPVMLEMELNQEDAQKLVTGFAKYEEARISAGVELIEAQRHTDLAALRADTERFGATDELFTASMGQVGRVMSMEGGDELHSLLKMHGIDNDRAFVNWAHGIAQHFAEDDVVLGKGKVTEDVRDVDAMYPNSE